MFSEVEVKAFARFLSCLSCASRAVERPGDDSTDVRRATVGCDTPRSEVWDNDDGPLEEGGAEKGEKERVDEEEAFCTSSPEVLIYNIFVVLVWLLVGAAVGLFGTSFGIIVGVHFFIAASSRDIAPSSAVHVILPGGETKGLSELPLITMPLCTLLSASCTLACQLLGIPAVTRIKVCVVIDAMAFACAFALAFFACYLGS